MTRTLFNEWINHVNQMYGNSNDNRYLLIMDGHNSHIVHEKGRDGGVSYRRDMYDFTRVKWS